MNYQWFKVYSEIKDDPKMLALTDADFRLWIHLMALASESPERGTIQPFPRRGLAAALHTTEDALTAALITFAEMDMARIDDDGSIILTHFLERQYDKPSDYPEAARERKSRQRARDNHPPFTPVSEDVTPESRAGHDTDKTRGEEKRGEERRDPSTAGAATTPPAVPAEKPIKHGEGTDAYEVAAHLRARILENSPKARVPGLAPAKLAGWAEQVDLMIRLDSRTPDEIRAVIDWCQADTFWRANILSAKTLREKYDRLDLQRRAPPRANGRSNGYAPKPAPTTNYMKGAIVFDLDALEADPEWQKEKEKARVVN